MICIYAIINTIDDKCYIGQTTDKSKRFIEHRKQLRGFYHHSLFLQRAWCKHGEQNFIFVILENVNDQNKLTEREQWWIDNLNPEYNIAPAAGSLKGYKHTEEARQNMSNAHKGEVRSEEFKKQLSERMKGNQYAKGQKQSLEHIEARANSRRGVLTSDETKMKMSEAQKGRKFTANHKLKLSLAARNRVMRVKGVLT